MKKNAIIACLDIQNGRTVKGTNFVNIIDAGDPLAMASKYCEEGADELVFLDITATIERRDTFFDLVKQLSGVTTVPFTVGGGIHKAEDMEKLLTAGAAKVSINTAAFKNPELIAEAARRFGQHKITIAIDACRRNGQWLVALGGGREVTEVPVVTWAKRVEALGAGCILLTSMEHDGTGSGFALDITQEVAGAVSIPVIASGGAGRKEDFREVFTKTGAAAALGAGVFHRNEINIKELKAWLNHWS